MRDASIIAITAIYILVPEFYYIIFFNTFMFL